jgi:hypothetical protein
MICVVYIDDTSIGALNVPSINQEIESLGITYYTKNQNFTLQNEDKISAFLGIQVKKLKPNEFQLTQTRLIKRI